MSNLSCGIVGLPNVGKSTLFNALLKKVQAGAENFPFCTIEPNVGIVNVPDDRLDVLSKLSKSKKVLPATMTFVDIAGLVKGASKGEGLGNQFLANIRETDAIVHVVRCFEDDEVVHVEGKIDPIGDIEVINLELILADLQMAQNSLQKIERQAKGNKALMPTQNLLQKIIDHLNENQPVRSIELTKEEKELLKTYHFITAKKVIYAANLSEEEITTLDSPHYRAVQEYAAKEKSQLLPFCAKLEEELAQLSEEEAAEYLDSLGLKEPGLNRLIKTSFETLGLITFLTTGEQETRAWTVPAGSPAPEAAGKIHTDIQKGFIRAEVVTFDDMVACSGRVGAKEAGKARSEGKDYTVQDGDVILFFHN
ncbi:redox-regulated ATPase YchF [Candidatus Neptunochlamydia vexilliferae]|uniref:Ribosome-binding ATPase YchF n=1 Tax=Candidatus Neptunichlamydia vexilliferae TaxID=1651774 RepID=A0ABS0AWM1_9BACT|nr:redox-regulated ATPase YchF [Candidatus Neptunochlamydia vexilliferae]MBF5058534.1 Ribosome-binding ATPase YchF [Candidatus Neptunochlamydia vexilliferae]